jgi:hypothetical protein
MNLFGRVAKRTLILTKTFRQIFFCAGVAFALTACEQTTIGNNWYPGVTVSLTNSQVVVPHASVLAGNAEIVTLDLRDTHYVAFIATDQTITFQATGGTSAGTFSPVTNNGDGTYSTTFSAITAGTATSIIGYVNGTPLQSTAPSIQVLTGNYSLANSVITVSQAVITSGSTSMATLTIKDASGNPVTSGGLTVLFSNSGGTSTGTLSGTTDNGDGTYTTTFTGTGSGTATNITATIQGQTITSALPSITVNPGVPLLSYVGSAGTSGTVGSALSVTPTTLNNQGSAIT